MVEMHHFTNGKNCISATEFEPSAKALNLITSEIIKTRKEIETVFNY